MYMPLYLESGSLRACEWIHSTLCNLYECQENDIIRHFSTIHGQNIYHMLNTMANQFQGCTSVAIAGVGFSGVPTGQVLRDDANEEVESDDSSSSGSGEDLDRVREMEWSPETSSEDSGNSTRTASQESSSSMES